MPTPKRLAILGSTGSIGTQALEVVSAQNGLFEVVALTAGNNADLLIEQAKKYRPAWVNIANEEKYPLVLEALKPLDIRVSTGQAPVMEGMTDPDIDMVLTAVVGFAGLLPTYEAIKAGKSIALANKETLVAGGQIIMSLAKEKGVPIIPVDSEHSALFQVHVGEGGNPIEKIYLTASGGPFRGYSHAQLKAVKPSQALKHPNWDMGAKITVDSASMMNKGLEVIEAKWLFDLRDEQIDVVVHPQSIIHSIVQYQDGSMKAQMGLPDMKLPIQYAMGYPQRLQNDFPRFDFLDYPQLTFERCDTGVFKNLALAYEAMKRGGNAACILNAANEITNRAFLDGKIDFTQIAEINGEAMNAVQNFEPTDIMELVETDQETRAWVKKRIEK